MNKFAITKIDANVRKTSSQCIEKNQIAGLQLVFIDMFANFADFFRGAWQYQSPGFLENKAHQAAAIQAGFWCVCLLYTSDAADE